MLSHLWSFCSEDFFGIKKIHTNNTRDITAFYFKWLRDWMRLDTQRSTKKRKKQFKIVLFCFVVRWSRHSNRHTCKRTCRCNVRSRLWWFTEFCNSHYLSHFAALVIVARTKISVVKSCVSVFTAYWRDFPFFSFFFWIEKKKEEKRYLFPLFFYIFEKKEKKISRAFFFLFSQKKTWSFK
jgi:hypothetical protein